MTNRDTRPAHIAHEEITQELISYVQTNRVIAEQVIREEVLRQLDGHEALAELADDANAVALLQTWWKVVRMDGKPNFRAEIHPMRRMVWGIEAEMAKVKRQQALNAKLATTKSPVFRAKLKIAAATVHPTKPFGVVVKQANRRDDELLKSLDFCVDKGFVQKSDADALTDALQEARLRVRTKRQPGNLLLAALSGEDVEVRPTREHRPRRNNKKRSKGKIDAMADSDQFRAQVRASEQSD